MLRRINLLYLSIPLVCWGLWSLFMHLNRGTASFYGFAENKETSINLDHDLAVYKIMVKPGQFVPKGAVLMEVTRIALDFKMSELAYSIEELKSKDTWRTTEIKAQIEKLRAESAEKTGNIQSEIRLLESEQELNRRLVQGLKSITVADSSMDARSPYNAKLNALRDELRLTAEPFQREINRLEQEYRLAGIPEKTQMNKLQKDIDLYHKEEERLKIYAPTDGLVGYVHCKEGENISAFTTLISFYEQSPNMVIGYIHESLSLQLKVGDSLRVTSTLRPSEHRMGVVSGLGHRVVEIPERLRKIPELRTYGREILIDIPGDNHFLQKEKVMVQRPDVITNPIQTLFSKK